MQVPTSIRRSLAIAGLFLTLLSAQSTPSRGQSGGSATIEGLRVGFAEGGSGRYKLGTWTPVRASLATSSPPFRGFLELVAPDDDGVPTAIRTPVELTESGPVEVTALVRIGAAGAEVRARLLDGEGRPLPGRSASATASPESLDLGVTLVLRDGDPSGLDELAELPRFRVPGGGRSLVVGPLGQLPDVPFGLDAIEAVVLETSDQNIRTSLARGDADRLRDWVARGGHLVVAIGEGWRETAEALGDLMPARPIEATGRAGLLEDLGALESFADKPFRVSGGRRLKVVPVEGWADRGGVPIASTAATPLVVRAAYGLGRVTLVGLDVAHPPFRDWPDRRYFWDKVLDLRRSGSEDLGGSYGSTGGGAIIQSAAPELGARLHRALEVFPGVKIVPFGWVAGFVLGYIVLIGPLEYLFLRKVAKRMELTWLTFPVIVAATCGLAFAGAYAIKGDELRVNKLDLVDYDQDGGTYRGRSWLTLYSPENHDYRLALEPAGPDFKPVPEAVEQSLSWYGSPDPVSRNMGRIALGQAAYRYEPAGEPRQLAGVRVAIWSTKAFVGRWSGTSKAVLLDSDLRPTSGDRLSGSVRNRLGKPMVRARLFYGRNVYDLGRIAPGAVVLVDPSKSEATTRYLFRRLADLDESAERRKGAEITPEQASLARADLLRIAMFHDALGNRASEAPSLGLRDLDLSAIAADLRRPMLVAEVEAPAATLQLADPPTVPIVAQTTLVRILLPLADGPDRTATDLDHPRDMGVRR